MNKKLISLLTSAACLSGSICTAAMPAFADEDDSGYVCAIHSGEVTFRGDFYSPGDGISDKDFTEINHCRVSCTENQNYSVMGDVNLDEKNDVLDGLAITEGLLKGGAKSDENGLLYTGSDDEWEQRSSDVSVELKSTASLPGQYTEIKVVLNNLSDLGSFGMEASVDLPASATIFSIAPAAGLDKYFSKDVSRGRVAFFDLDNKDNSDGDNIFTISVLAPEEEGEYPITLTDCIVGNAFGQKVSDIEIKPAVLKVGGGTHGPSVSKEPVEGVLYGDATADQSINEDDALAVERFVVGYDEKIDIAAADVNLDGVINIADAYAVRSYLDGGKALPLVDIDTNWDGYETVGLEASAASCVCGHSTDIDFRPSSEMQNHGVKAVSFDISFDSMITVNDITAFDGEKFNFRQDGKQVRVTRYYDGTKDFSDLWNSLKQSNTPFFTLDITADVLNTSPDAGYTVKNIAFFNEYGQKVNGSNSDGNIRLEGYATTTTTTEATTTSNTTTTTTTTEATTTSTTTTTTTTTESTTTSTTTTTTTTTEATTTSTTTTTTTTTEATTTSTTTTTTTTTEATTTSTTTTTTTTTEATTTSTTTTTTTTTEATTTSTTTTTTTTTEATTTSTTTTTTTTTEATTTSTTTTTTTTTETSTTTTEAETTESTTSATETESTETSATSASTTTTVSSAVTTDAETTESTTTVTTTSAVPEQATTTTTGNGDLPQTGYPVWYRFISYIALAMTVTGMLLIKVAFTGRKRRTE